MLPVDRDEHTTDDPAPWLHPHRAQQGLHSYDEPVRLHAPRRYSLPSRFSRLAGSLSPRTAVSGHAFPRSMHEQQTGLTSPTCRTPPGQNSGHPPNSSRADLLHPGFDATLLSNDTSTAIPENEDCAPSSRSPPDASGAPFPHRSPRRRVAGGSRTLRPSQIPLRGIPRNGIYVQDAVMLKTRSLGSVSLC